MQKHNISYLHIPYLWINKLKLACPLCERVIDGLVNLRRHLGRHLEELARFSLPSIDNSFSAEEDKTSDHSSVLSASPLETGSLVALHPDDTLDSEEKAEIHIQDLELALERGAKLDSKDLQTLRDHIELGLRDARNQSFEQVRAILKLETIKKIQSKKKGPNQEKSTDTGEEADLEAAPFSEDEDRQEVKAMPEGQPVVGHTSSKKSSSKRRQEAKKSAHRPSSSKSRHNRLSPSPTDGNNE